MTEKNQRINDTNILSDRQKKILYEAIGHHINHAVPVGSQSIANASQMKLSSATIRQELNTLESKGYLKQLHISSGRVPTDKGYKEYIKTISTHNYNISLEKQTLAQSFDAIKTNAKNLTDILSSSLTNITGYPSISLIEPYLIQSLQTIQLILLNLNRILVVFLTEAGVNNDFIVDSKHDISKKDIAIIQDIFNATKAEGIDVSKILNYSSESIEWLHDIRSLSESAWTLFLEIINHMQEVKAAKHASISGLEKLLSLPDFHNYSHIANIFETFKTNSILLDLWGKYKKHSNLTVLVGSDTGSDDLNDCSVIFSTIKHENIPIGALGVLGPKRMPYHEIIPLISNASTLLSEHIAKILNKEENSNEQT